jgi:hypothetical protein
MPSLILAHLATYSISCFSFEICASHNGWDALIEIDHTFIRHALGQVTITLRDRKICLEAFDNSATNG